MRVRTQLIVAFVGLAVIPMAGLTLYSYVTSIRAFRQAVHAEASSTASQMGERMRSRTSTLNRRLHRLSQMQFDKLLGEEASEQAPVLYDFLVREMGSDVSLLESLEFRPMVSSSPPVPPLPTARRSSAAEAAPVRFGSATQESITIVLPAPPGNEMEELGEVAAQLEISIRGDVQRKLIFHRKDRKIDLEKTRGPPGSRNLQVENAFAYLTPLEIASSVEMAGERRGTISARVRTSRLLREVVRLSKRKKGGIPFALDPEGALFTPDESDLPTLQSLALDREGRDDSAVRRHNDWIVVSHQEPESQMTFGIARPIGKPLEEIRRTAGRNLLYGFAMIGVALLGVLPLSNRMTRNLDVLSSGARQLSEGDLSVRVPESSKDEFGQLAATFNRMAVKLEEHQEQLLEQERIRKELEMCRQIQEQLLPRSPLQTSFGAVQGVSVPARELGGDFFNYFSLPGGEFAVLIGDVSGKGVPAALLMANIQATLRARLPVETDFCRLVETLDQEVARQTPAEAYLTLFVAILSRDGSRMRYANAGHNSQFLLRADHRAQRLCSTGRPLGLLPGGQYQTVEVDLEPGDWLFLYTDGLIEAENSEGEEFGMERLEKLLVGVGPERVDMILADVEAAASRHRGSVEAQDDSTLLLLQHRGSG